MSLMGESAIAIWNDIADEGRAEFHEWHAREHMPERLSIPGFNRGRRYHSLAADIEFFTLYEIGSIDVATGSDYRAKLNNPTQWSTRMARKFRSNFRGVCRVEHTAGPADGAYMAVIRLDPEDDHVWPLAHHVRALLDKLLEMPRVCGGHLAIAEPAASGTRTRLQSARKIIVPAWVVMIEAASAPACQDAAKAFLEAIDRQHLAGPPANGLYEFEYGITTYRQA